MSRHPSHAWISLVDAPVYVLTYPTYDEQDAQTISTWRAGVLNVADAKSWARGHTLQADLAKQRPSRE